jgi:hypothetical protein
VGRDEPAVRERRLAEHHPQAPGPEDADEYKDEKGKHDKYFSANPGQGT